MRKIKSLFLIAIINIFIIFRFYNFIYAIAPPFNIKKEKPNSFLKSSKNLMITTNSQVLGNGINCNIPLILRQNQNINLIVILVNFLDVKMNQIDVKNIYNTINRMCDYFKFQSNNKLIINYTITHQIYTLNKTMAYYGIPDDAQSLIYDTILISDNDIDFSKYNALMIVHAGLGDETNPNTKNTQDIWSVYWYDYAGILTNDNVYIKGATIAPKGEYNNIHPLGVICHEFGHQLGLPDLYDTTYTTEGGLGAWSLMATGTYNGNPIGYYPAPLDPWCRYKLSWIDFEVLDKSYINFNFEFNKVYKINSNNITNNTDYFLIEKKAKIPNTFDEGLIGEGLLIYHVNALAELENSISPNNSNPGLIWLMCANGNDHLIKTPRSNIRGLPTDPYPNDNNNIFSFYSIPSSKTWSGTDSNIAIYNIKRIGSGKNLQILADVKISSNSYINFKVGYFLIPGVDNIVLVIKPLINVNNLEIIIDDKKYNVTKSSNNKFYYLILNYISNGTNVKINAYLDSNLIASENFTLIY